MKVLVVPEDPTFDQYVLKPIAEKLFEDLGKRARVTVLANPRLRGVAQALDARKLAEVVSLHPMIDLFLLMVDRDGDEARHHVAAARESERPRRLFVCLAIEEIEVWIWRYIGILWRFSGATSVGSGTSRRRSLVLFLPCTLRSSTQAAAGSGRCESWGGRGGVCSSCVPSSTS